VEPPESQKAQISAAGGMDAAAAQLSQALTAMGVKVTVKSHKIEGVTVNGDEATVKLTMTLDQGMGEQTKTDDLKLKRVQGEWKIDGTAAQANMLGGMGPGPQGGKR